MTILINPQPSHIRPIHLDKDIRPVADLVELCFDQAMDAEGRAYLHNIRMAGKSVSPLYLSSLTPETTNIPFCGYVWEEGGTILGNITLIFAKRNQQHLYFIANVSVHPEHRGRGIAKKLTERALRHVKEHQGSHVMLQVREDNPPAIHVYESLGFVEINRRTNWIVDRTKRPVKSQFGDVRVTGRRSEDWPQHKTWLQDLFPESVGWFLPFNIKKHTPGVMNWLDRWLNSDVIRVWAVRNRDHLLGLGSLESVNPHQDYLWLATSPANEDVTIRTLLPYVIHKIRQPNKLQVNYPAGRAVDAFSASGMKVLNTLIWMEVVLSNDPS